MRVMSPRRKNHPSNPASTDSSLGSTISATQQHQNQPKQMNGGEPPIFASMSATMAGANVNGVVASSQQQQRRKDSRGGFSRPPPIDTSSPTSRKHHPSPSVRSPTSPTTDDGAPTTSVHSDLMRALKLIEDERHLVAYELYRSSVLKIEELEDSKSVDGLDDASIFSAESSASVMSELPRPAHQHSKHHFSFFKHRGGGQNALRAEREKVERNKRIQAQQQRKRDILEAKLLLEREKEEFERLEDRALLFQKAKENLTIDDDWKICQTLFGITTYYRRENDNSLSIKLEGELYGIPLFEQLAVLRECDLYHHWAPFCTSSRKLAQLNKIDVVAWFNCALPLFHMSRDACFRAIGCDSMREDGSIMLVAEGLGDKEEDGAKPTMEGHGSEGSHDNGGSSNHENSSNYFQYMESERSGISDSERSSNQRLTDSLSSYLSRDSILETIQIPPISTKWGCGRMSIRSFQCCIDVLSPTSARTRIVTNVNPNLHFIPQSLIDFCMKKMCGVLLSRLQGAARKVLKDPIKAHHARRMREDVGFYQHWLLPKFKSYCDELGWEMPPVGALAVNEDDLDEDEYYIYHQLARSPSSHDGPNSNNGENQENIVSFHMASSTVSEPITTGAGVSEGRAAARETRSLGPQPETCQRPYQSMPIPGPSRAGQPTVGRSARISKSVNVGKSIVQKPVNFMKEMESKAEEKKMRSIAASRRKAARRLKASTFTNAQRSRLEQLKSTKNKSKERGSVMFGATPTDLETDSISIVGSVATSSVSQQKDETREGLVGILLGLHPTFTPLQTLPYLVLTMFIVFFSAEVTTVYTYAISSVNADYVVSATSAPLETTVLYYLGIVGAQICRIIAMISILTAFSVLHWSVVNAVLTVGMGDIYIGEETARQSLEMGMKMCTKIGYKYVTIVTVGLAAIASGKALLSLLVKFALKTAIMFGVKKVSYIAGDAAASVFGIIGAFGGRCWNYMPIRPLLEAINRDLATNLRSMPGVRIISKCFSLVERTVVSIFGTLEYVVTRAQQISEKRCSSIKILSYFGGTFYPLLNGDNDDVEVDVMSWRKSAIDTSRLTLAYSALFHLTLLAAAHFLLPEPNKKKSTERRKDVTTSERHRKAEFTAQISPSHGSASSTGDASSVGSSRHGASVGSTSFEQSSYDQPHQNINAHPSNASNEGGAGENADHMPRIQLSHDVINEEDDSNVSDAAVSSLLGENLDATNASSHDEILVNNPIAPTKRDKKKSALKKFFKSRRKNRTEDHPDIQPTVSTETRPLSIGQ